ncbi:universal stress protein [Desulfobulbus elongatus]|uniref:universal stress protein n=1 Tax=Desulfobulbus elongatus TaxID=53332 RepID=UPI000A631C7A|nr:universal stress protein [Desulfobulbus elongatus]
MPIESAAIRLSQSEPGPNTGTVAPARPNEPSFIMALTRNGHMSEHVMEHAVNLSQRLGYAILAVHVDTLPLFNRGRRSRLFAAAMEESTALLAEMAQYRSVAVEHLGESGKVGDVVGRLCRSKRRIEFIVIDKGIRMEEVARSSPVPVFPVRTARHGLFSKTLSHTQKTQGVFAMSTSSKKRYVRQCVLFGALTSALYATVFAYQDVVMTYFSKGGVYAVLPVITVFAVSYFHGNFTSAFWSALGIEASKKSAARQVAPEQKVTDTAPRPDTRPRLQVNA